MFDNYIDRVAIQCVNTLTPKWATKLAAFDVYVADRVRTWRGCIRPTGCASRTALPSEVRTGFRPLREQLH